MWCGWWWWWADDEHAVWMRCVDNRVIHRNSVYELRQRVQCHHPQMRSNHTEKLMRRTGMRPYYSATNTEQERARARQWIGIGPHSMFFSLLRFADIQMS